MVKGKERIAIIGDNGTGKTTLVKMIMGEEKPDSGFVRRGPSVKAAYLPQIIRFDNPRRSVMDTLVYEQNESPQTARNRLGKYLFSGEDVFKQVDDLSGGEKSRLRLCMLMNGEINMLILDEPTNHLDLASRDWMEDALMLYDETLLFISHDRYFINKFATRIWSLENGVFTDFYGSYEQYTKQSEASASSSNKKRESRPGSLNKKESSAQRSRKVKPSDASKELRRIEREIESLESGIEALRQLKHEHSTDYEKLMELDIQELEYKDQLDVLLDEWEHASGMVN